MADALVLDTSACFGFLEDEAGADVVESCLVEAKEGPVFIHLSFATLTEVEYITTQERSTSHRRSRSISPADKCHPLSKSPTRNVTVN